MRMKNQTLYRSVLLWLLLCWGVTGEERRYVRDVSFTNKRCSSSSLIDYGTSRSVLQCSILCGKDTACYSFFYNTIGGVCNGVAAVYPSANSCDPDTGSRYYYQREFLETIPCSADGHCPATTQCSSTDHCQCLPGLSLVPATGQCVVGCQEYGETFSQYRNKDLRCGGIYYSNVNEAQCKAKCFPKDCLSVSFNAKINHCKVRQCTPLDAQLVKYNNVHTFVRNCA